MNMTNLTQQFNLNNALADALEAYVTDFIAGDLVVFTEESRPYLNSIFSIENVYQNDCYCIYNSQVGYVDRVPAAHVRHATIVEIKNKKRGCEAAALFVSDIDVHYQRAMLAQGEMP